MEREASQPGSADRERRARLEQLQVELRQVKAQLTDVPAATKGAVAALERAVASAKARLDAERQRAARLEEDVRAAKALVASLKGEVEEARVLARGQELRDRYVDWLPEDQRRSNAPDPSVFIAVIPLIGIAGLLIALMVQGCLK